MSLHRFLLLKIRWLIWIQVSPTATEAQLKTAYKKGALKYHPGMFTHLVAFQNRAENILIKHNHYR